jgi:hypothetical protein
VGVGKLSDAWSKSWVHLGSINSQTA